MERYRPWIREYGGDAGNLTQGFFIDYVIKGDTDVILYQERVTQMSWGDDTDVV